MQSYLQSFTTKQCSCGKTHAVDIPKIVIESGAINKIAKLVNDCGAKKVFVLADSNTFAVAGDKVCRELKNNDIPYSTYTFISNHLEPNETSVGSAVMHYDNSCNLLIAVGSGVINDIGKILSATAKVPYVIVATAPSMDGYASATSSVALDGLKTSLPSKCADVIVGDLDILKNAPINMLQAGLGDMLAKYISIAEWKISNVINGEYYCETIAGLIKTALKRCVDNAKGLISRDEEAVKSVFEGLIIGGVAMALAGVSRPASGVEHYFSHVWDMRGLEFNTSVNLHGLQCAVATKIALGIYEDLIKTLPDKQKALKYASEFDYTAWAKTLKEFFGKGADAMIALEEKEFKYSVNSHAKRLEVIIEKWDEIVAIIKQDMPTVKQIDDILNLIQAPKTVSEIGIDCDILITLKATKDIRDKYVLSRLLWDLGVLDDIKL